MVNDTDSPASIELLWLVVQVTDFKHGKQWPIMIVSYETLRKFADSLAGFCDVLICDEGHRYVATWQHAKSALGSLLFSMVVVSSHTP